MYKFNWIQIGVGFHIVAKEIQEDSKVRNFLDFRVNKKSFELTHFISF